MKTFFILLIAFISSTNLFADCNSNGLYIFPSTPTLKQNSIIILEGYGVSQEIIRNLNKKYPIYLKNGSQKIFLIAKEKHEGLFYLTQALLTPLKPLEVGKEYTLCIDSLPEYEYIYHWNEKTKQHDQVVWEITEGNDTQKPVVNSQPKEIGKELTFFGCGPSIHVLFNCPVKDNSEVIIKATMKSLQSGKRTTYYIRPHEDKISIGHGMCSGEFDFDDGENYEIEFSFMDLSGNVSDWIGKPIKFTRPT